MTKDQIYLFLTQAFASKNEWAPIYAAAIYTGARNGELIALTWEQIDFENMTITINKSWSKQNGLKCTKSGDERLVPIAPAFLEILKELRETTNDTPYVLPRLHQWISGGDQAGELRFFLAGLGLPQINFHALRSCHAVMLLQSGVPAVKVMATCGWKSYKSMNHYIRTAGVDIKGMMDNLSKLLVAGASVSTVDAYGNTPLHNARQPEVIQKLIAAGAGIEAQNRFGNTPLFGKSTWDGDAKTEEMCGTIPAFLTAGANFSHKNKKGHNVLLSMLSGGHIDSYPDQLSENQECAILELLDWACPQHS